MIISACRPLDLIWYQSASGQAVFAIRRFSVRVLRHQLLFWVGYFLNILLTAFLISFSTLLASAAISAEVERVSVSFATPRKMLMPLFVSRSSRSVPVVTF